MIIKDRFEEYLQACCKSGKSFGDFAEEEFDTEVESWEIKYGRIRPTILG